MSTSAAAHPRFAEALTALGLHVPVRAFPDATAPGRRGSPACTADGAPRGGVDPVRAAGVRRAEETTVLADRRLPTHNTVWAAAGTPHTVFPTAPAEPVADVRERTA